MTSAPGTLQDRVIPAVPVPFRGGEIAVEAQCAYAEWMARHEVAGVAVWAHTGRGPYLSADQRRLVLDCWRSALPGRLVVAGARDLAMAVEARRGGADAILAFPSRDHPIAFHERLCRELPVIAFYLYEAAGGVAYDDATLHAILELPGVIGIKVATLDSVMTFQRIAAVMRSHPGKVLLTGEDRFLGYSIMLGARAALIGMGAALTDLPIRLLRSHGAGCWQDFARLSARCDEFGQATFVQPMEGYIRRMLWALAEEGVLPADCCEDPWGPALPGDQEATVRHAVRNARADRG